MNLPGLLRVLSFLEREYPTEDTLSDRIDRAKNYVDNHFYRAEIVQALPASSDPGHLYVVPGDINLYIGAQGGSYRKLPTQATP